MCVYIYIFIIMISNFQVKMYIHEREINGKGTMGPFMMEDSCHWHVIRDQKVGYDPFE